MTNIISKNSKALIIGASIIIAVLILCLFAFSDKSPEMVGGVPAIKTDAENGTTQVTGWMTRCQDEEKTQCEVFQSVYLAQNGNLIRLIELAISRSQKTSDSFTVGVAVPLGVIIPNGVSLLSGETVIEQFPLKQCVSTGCVGLKEVSSETLDKVQAQDQIVASFIDGTGQQINVVLSLQNFLNSIKNI